ncbi:MAG: HTTM domain-containing protein [Byssovorax sp.]
MTRAALPANDAPDEAAPTAPPPPDRSFLRLLRDDYLTFDRRTLGFARWMLGFFLITDLFHRGRSWADLYSSEGVLPTTLGLSRPQSPGSFTVFLGFSSPGELRVLWALMLVAFVGLLIGYKTRLMQILAVVLVTGMNGRVLLTENGGYTVQNLLVLWTCFLPLGDRFSLDALLASMKRRREASAAELNDRSDLVLPGHDQPLITLLGPIVLIQLSAIYFFNVVHKTGIEWKDGTAVHYVLYIDRIATPLVALVRDHLPLPVLKFMTHSAMAMEASIPIALLAPLARTWSRRIAIALINALHIAFGATFVLGPFAWACCVFSTLLFTADDWELAHRTMRRASRARTVVFDARSPAALLVCRLLKRLDGFELLTFREGQPGPLGIEIEIEIRSKRGRAITRSAPLTDAIAALPLGPLVALPLRAPILRDGVGALLAAIERRDVSAWLGLAPRPSFTAAGPSPLRLRGRAALRIFGQVLALVFFAGAVNIAMVQLWVIKKMIRVHQAPVLMTFTGKLRFLQGWYMFSPGPAMDDGTLVVDAITVDGRHVDPLTVHVEPYTLRAPDFDLIHARSLRTNQLWGDYFKGIAMPGYYSYREALKDYLLALPQRTGHPDDAIVSGEVFWVSDNNPRWGETQSYGLEKKLLFTFDGAGGFVSGPTALPGMQR